MAGWLQSVGVTANSSSVTSFTISPAQAVVAGDTLVLAVALGGSGTGTVSATDSAGNTYTVRYTGVLSGDTRLVVLIAENVAALTTSQSVTVTIPSDNYAAVCEEYQAATGYYYAFDTASANATGNSSSLLSGSATPTTSADVAIGALK